MEGLTEFLESSSIHGLFYISNTRRLVRLFWVSVVITFFTGAGVLIQQSFSSWAESPISTTIETRPITEMDFPNVTVCPPRNSFTSLIPDLVRSRNINIQEDKRKELSDGVRKSMVRSNHNAKYGEFLTFRQDTYMEWYTGISKIALPVTYDSTVKQYIIETNSLAGSFSTLHFGEPFEDLTFERELMGMIYINVPMKTYGSNIIIDIEYDIGKISHLEYITVGLQEKTENETMYSTKEATSLDKNKYFSTINFDLGSMGRKRISVTYMRKMWDEYHSWSPKRNTGMKVSWAYTKPETLQPESSYIEANKHFILLANIIHQIGREVEESLRELVNEMIMNAGGRYGWMCRVGEVTEENSELLLSKYGNISDEPIFKNEITEEILETSAILYFGVTFCPDYDPRIQQFYERLLKNFPTETIVKTLARILSVTNEKKLTEHYQTAKYIFDKTSTLINLQNRAITIRTTPASELELYPDLASSETKIIPDSSHLEMLMNHPVHISDIKTPSAFIPFCFFGVHSFGKKISNFQIPVCSLFEEKLVNGQVCYEANMNQYNKDKKSNWEEVLNKGLGLIIDTSDEYDLKNIIKKKSSNAEDNSEYLDIYKNSEDKNSFFIKLNTINPVPLELQGEGHYGLTAIKDIKVTEEFLGLGQEITRCQTKEARTDCVSRRYQEQVLASCHCAPLYIRSHFPQETEICSSQQLDCVTSLVLDTEDCLEQCEGTIADVTKVNNPVNEDGIKKILQEYENYKYPTSTNMTYPDSMKDLKFINKLKYVQISFATSVFDRIEKVRNIEGDQTALYLSDTLQDRSAKFVDQLSAIGGTMGLLTGFSLISGVEILYFTVKIVINIMRATPVKTV